MLPIRQNINQLTGINRTYKAVLIEVCELVENGTKGNCSADNDHFASRLSASLRTISRTLTGLEKLGLIESFGATNKRVILPTPGLRACYAGTDTTAALNALSDALISATSDGPTIDKTIDKQGATIDSLAQMAIVKSGPTIDNRDTTIDNCGSNYSQTGSRVYRDEQTSIDEQEEEAHTLRSTLAAAEKKIRELEEKLAEVTHQRNQLRASVLAQRPTGANASASHTGGAAGAPKMTFAQSQYATPEGFTKLATALTYPTAYAPHYLAHIAVAAGEGLRDEKGWQNFVRRYLEIDANSDNGLITTPPKDSSTNASQRSTSFPQQRGGQKPTGNAGQLARAFAERRRKPGE
ncbi:helix-turn-helix domain-containing protein [Hymenobacter sp. YC55]|uniref:helix-turn-helix domain-containing protein n=1 Tax=Hymenobacter sp. YC55 TaxID=3034019 RepID=UPI0023F90061|nr:helix-turn-helix domain-containing protein [Hymenobacter sp. YC55]MDF7813633.1 helix-turn-helix domain-containing protein [Hymenobacter sp. YC55]